jgi:hypothetical protein
VLHDPATYPTPTGDGIVTFQYKQVVNNDSERMYATVGIESPDETTGIECTYDNSFADGAAPLSAGLAISFSTIPPRYSPLTVEDVTVIHGGGGVEIGWRPSAERVCGGFRIYRDTGTDDAFDLVRGGLLAADARSFVDADAGSEPSYKIGIVDTAGRETLFGPFAISAASSPPLTLTAVGPNPFRATTLMSYALPSQGAARLAIYTVSGRLVRTLLEGELPVGRGTATWDGRDQSGREVPSGVYFGRLETAGGERTVKLALLR